MAPASTLPTLSPRAQFQDSVRKLGSNESQRHRRNKSISLNYNPYELQHVSSLRVSPIRRSGRRITAISPASVSEEPDFGAKERDVWSRHSPEDRVDNIGGLEKTSYGEIFSSPSQPGSLRNGQPTLLRPELKACTNEEQRPKTRHEPTGLSAFRMAARRSNSVERENLELSTRAAKFTEGTMTSRSGAVASTWSDAESMASSTDQEETDSELTPKVDRKRRSESFDLRDFQPPSLTPSAIKRTLFGRRETKKEKEKISKKEAQSEEKQIEKPKRRLRKSISKLQFIGEKMKLFGTSTHDLSESTSQKSSRDDSDNIAILEERKRKAEELYAIHYTLKKQRDNDGLANVIDYPGNSISQDPAGNQKYDSSTVRCRGAGTHSRRTSTGSIRTMSSLHRDADVNEHDARKRPTRRELEKENQELRALLRQSEASYAHDAPYKSESESLPPIRPLRIRRHRQMPGTPEITRDGGDVLGDEDTVPVPPIPPQNPGRRSILGDLSNSRTTPAHSDGPPASSDNGKPMAKSTMYQQDLVKAVVADDSAPQEQKTDLSTAARGSVPPMPRSVSVIVEEPEGEIEEKKRSLRSRKVALGKENTIILKSSMTPKDRKEKWQWPDDVF